MFPNISVAGLYLAWSFLRSFLTRGWWLVTSLYLVVDAGLSPFELVFIGTAQALVVILGEVPAGVFADALSRKWSLVLAHALMGLGMMSTGLVLSFPALVVTQMIWGLSWTFSSGSDVAWLTDELDDSEQSDHVLIQAVKWSSVGAILGVLMLGGLGWMTSLETAILVAGTCMWLLGLWVAFAFKEQRFTPAGAGTVLTSALYTLRQGLVSIRVHRVLIHVCLALVAASFGIAGALMASAGFLLVVVVIVLCRRQST